MHPYLNHLGSDLCRGLLEFGVGRPLGSTGLRWLKIHLANVFAGGVDKLSFSERVAFVDQNIDNIKNSAERPLEGNRWWSGAEDPFQCLAACMSLRDALESGDVEKYICFTPVQQVLFYCFFLLHAVCLDFLVSLPSIVAYHRMAHVMVCNIMQP